MVVAVERMRLRTGCRSAGVGQCSQVAGTRFAGPRDGPLALCSDGRHVGSSG